MSVLLEWHLGRHACKPQTVLPLIKGSKSLNLVYLNKKNIIDIAKAKGATAALKFANNLIMNRSGEEREAITASVIEVVSRDEFIETAKEDDLGTIREIIGGCLDEDNKKQNPQLIDYVQSLGGVSKDIKSRIKAQEMTVEEDTKSIGAQQPSRDDDEPEL